MNSTSALEVPMTPEEALAKFMEQGAGLGGTKQQAVESTYVQAVTGDKHAGVWRHPSFPDGVESFKAVILGFQDQRTAWPPYDRKNKSAPICRSLDGETGYPTSNFMETYKGKTPLEVSGLELKAIPDEDGVVRRYESVDGGPLRCEDCGMSNWGGAPEITGGDKPWCGEQITVLYAIDVRGDGTQYVNAKQTFQGTGLTPVKELIARFEQGQIPTISKIVEVDVVLVTEDNSWIIPDFNFVGDVEADLVPGFAQAYFELTKQITDPTWLTRDRSEENDERSLDEVEAKEETAF